jgi:hypothetical protein
MRHAGVTKGYQLSAASYLLCDVYRRRHKFLTSYIECNFNYVFKFLRAITLALFMLKNVPLWHHHEKKKVAFDLLAHLLCIR